LEEKKKQCLFILFFSLACKSKKSVGHVMRQKFDVSVYTLFLE